MKKEAEVIRQMLEEMQGHKFIYGNHEHTITSFQIYEDKEKITVQTNRKCYERPFESAMVFLNQFQPVKKDDWGVMETGEPQLPQMQINSQVIAQLKDVLLDNIEKVKKDKEYIAQATAVKLSVDSVIDLAKIEVAYMEAYVRVKKNS